MLADQNDHAKIYDVIIIGQGLAGSLLAWELIQAGQHILVIDNHHIGSSSKVAAGIVNPVTGHRINITQGYDDFLAAAHASYAQLTATFNDVFIENIPQLRLIKNQGQYDYYQKRLQDPAYSHFIQSPLKSHPFYKANQFGIGEIQHTYRVHAKRLLTHMQTYLHEKQALLKQKMDYQNVKLNHTGIEITLDQTTLNSTIKAKKLVCCEGYQAIHNPWFKELPFKLAKGEILTISLDQKTNKMLNWGSWLLPKINNQNQPEKNLAELGASYDWQDLSLETNAQTAQKLMDSLLQKTRLSGTIIHHQAGIRPTTHERKQLIGQHPKHQHLYCFNGFGSKGCLTIPHYAKKLTKHLCAHIPLSILNPELDQHLSLANKPYEPNQTSSPFDH